MSVLRIPMLNWGILLDEARLIVVGEQQALQMEVPIRPTLIPAPAAPARASVGSGRTVATSLLYDVRRL